MQENKRGFNRLGLLGFLGFLFLLWPVTGEWGFIFTVGYFTFFKYWRIIPDECFRDNVKSSASTGFFVTQVLFAATLISWAVFCRIFDLIKDFYILYWGIISSIALGFMVFSFKLSALEKREKKDIKHVE
ncbi:MAG: DUF3796 domain-containing protein [Bacteroidales bacterium]|nr:DUF3796 domain-containing protein [Bacteroidales bacterium]